MHKFIMISSAAEEEEEEIGARNWSVVEIQSTSWIIEDQRSKNFFEKKNEEIDPAVTEFAFGSLSSILFISLIFFEEDKDDTVSNSASFYTTLTSLWQQ